MSMPGTAGTDAQACMRVVYVPRRMGRCIYAMLSLQPTSGRSAAGA